VPDLLDRLDIEVEGIGQRLLGKAGGNPDPRFPVASLSSAKRPDESRWSSISARTCGASSSAGACQPLDGVGNRCVPSSISGSPSPAVGHSSETVSAMSPT
jgi:hypothetical protein